jgi:hypothetical protein
MSGRGAAVAKHILGQALAMYRRPDGYEGYLVEAAWRLEHMGLDAWPALSALATENVPECEFLLGAMVRLNGVSDQERRWALLAAARNPDANTRSRLLELLHELPDNLRAEVLRTLAASRRPDDDVTDRAREAVGFLAL